MVQIDISPSQAAQLAHAKASKNRNEKQRAPVGLRLVHHCPQFNLGGKILTFPEEPYLAALVCSNLHTASDVLSYQSLRLRKAAQIGVELIDPRHR
jgi:hypothetical protein